MIKSTSLAIIAICYIANTFSVYESETGGYNVFFGSFGYHIEGESK